VAAKKRSAIAKGFKENPFQKLPDGTRKYKINFWRKIEHGKEVIPENPLEVFDTPKEVFDYLKGEWYTITCGDTETDAFEGTSSSYRGPKIHLFPDSNIVPEWNSSRRREMMNWMRSLSPSGELFVIDQPPIARFESKIGGLNNLDLTAETVRGQLSLEKRMSLNEDQRREMTTFYDIIEEFFKKETLEIYRLSDKNPRETPENLASVYAQRIHPERKTIPHYTQMVSKLIEKYREGNVNNIFTDKVLASTGFAMNLVGNWDKAIVVSDDKDLAAIFDLFYNEIMPRYMARTVIDAIKVRQPHYLAMPGYESRTVEAAKKQIEWAKSLGENMAVGILYSPQRDELYVNEVAGALKHYFNNVQAYRFGKSELISRMALTGWSAEKAVRALVREGK